MEAIVSFFASLGIDLWELLITAAVLLVGSILFSAMGRFVFGKKSTFNVAVSSAIGIVFIYLAFVLMNLGGEKFQVLLAPLPFVSIENNTLYFQVLQGHYAQICSNILSMIILSFLVNLADRWLPAGKNLFTWLFFRVLTVIIGYILHLVVVYLFHQYLPQGLVIYAPTVLLAILLLMILTGALKLIVGTFLSVSMGPVIGGLYTFFFANVIGKLVTRAVLTTAILIGIIALLNYLGVYSLSIGFSALIAYIPCFVGLIGLWYFVQKTF